jgi:hypothetical protein
VSLFQAHGIRSNMVESSRSQQPIVLRDRDKNDIDLPSDPSSVDSIATMTANLGLINESLQNAFIGLHIPDSDLHALGIRLAGGNPPRYVDFSRKRLHRVFNNGSLLEGGRFYGGWWQGIPSSLRKHLHIAHPRRGHRYTAELDYSSMHLAIAYALVGVGLDFDPYQVDPIGRADDPETCATVRKVGKTALNALLNADSRSSAKRAVCNSLVLERDRNGVRAGEDYLPVGCPPLDDLFDKLIAKNHQISKFIGTGAGTRLMYVESQIAEETMLKVIRKSRAVVLPVHDSFIVHRSYRWDLEGYMRETFEETVGQPCNVDFDPMESADFGSEVLSGEAILDLARTALHWENAEERTFFTMWDDWSHGNQNR